MKLSRRIAALAAAALSAGVLVSSGPARAATGNIDYSCKITDDYSFTFTFDQDTTMPTLPAKAFVGKTYSPTYSAKTSLPADGVNLARFFGVTSFDGAIDATVFVDGVARTVHAPIKKTPVPSSGGIVLTATGPFGAVKKAAVGTSTIKPGPIKFTVNAYRADNSKLFGISKASCTMVNPNDANRILDSVTYVKSPTKITPAVTYAPATKKVSAAAVIGRTSGVPATGKVTFVLYKGTTKLKTVISSVAANKATASFLNVKAKGTYKVVMTYSGSAALITSTATKSFVIR